MRHFDRILMLSAILVIFSMPACTEQGQEKILSQGDKIAQDIKTVTETGQQLIESPVGQFIPPDVKFWIVLGGALAAGLANGWQSWRSSQMKKTTKAIVAGIEKVGQPTTTDNPASTVKAAIAKEMLKTGCYDTCNKIVDKLKAT